MNKKQLRLYAKKFEGASDLARMIFSILAVLGLWYFLNFFMSTQAMVIAGGMYACVMGFAYWWVRGQWRALLAPPPKPVKKKPAVARPPAPPKDTP